MAKTSGNNPGGGNPERDEILLGTSLAEILKGGGGNDVLTGNDGNDTLNGGGGSDTFVFNFSVQVPQQASTFTDWLGDRGHGAATGNGELLDGTPQNFFSTQYTAWLDGLVAEYGLGADQDGDGLIAVGLNQNALVGTPAIEGMSPEALQAIFSERESVMLQTGATEKERFYSDHFSLAGEAGIAEADGCDTIVQFQNAGPNVDKLHLHGITLEQAREMFEYATGDFDLDGSADDSRLSWEGIDDSADGSITILGTTWTDLNLLLTGVQVVFSA